MMHFDALRATSEAHDGSYHDYPDFGSDVEPLVFADIDSLGAVYCLLDENLPKRSRLVRRMLSHGIHVSPGIVSLIPRDLEKADLTTLKTFTYHGHLELWYRPVACSLVATLVGMYPCISHVTDIAEVVPDESLQQEFTSLVNSLESQVLFSFGGDGDPMYVVGEMTTLQPFSAGRP